MARLLLSRFAPPEIPGCPTQKELIMNKTVTSQDTCSAKNRGGGTVPGRKASKMKLLAGILLLFTVLVSGCQPIEPAAAGSPAVETEQAQTFLDLASETLDMDALLPMDPSIRKAQLDNGLTYYIRHNTNPANRATLMLAVNAGSLQEDDDQLGLAHFLEHMMFNGTERFPKQALTDYFESVGISSGADVNAYTSYDETAYFLDFPTDDEAIVNTAFQVVEDWASRATISAEEVDKERGVILEEERLRGQDVFGRLNKQLIPFRLGESRYAERYPIGDLEIIRNVPAETLRRFYRDWYRPDLMAVIVVGDIDADAIEAKIIEHFSGLPAPQTPRPRLTYSLPDHGDTRYLNFTDPEMPMTFAQISFRQRTAEPGAFATYRNNIISHLFYTMLNYRLNDIVREADSPFLSAFVTERQLVRGFTSQDIGVQARPGELLSGLDAALTEIERVRRHGFTVAELARAKSELLNVYARRFNDRENLWNRHLAMEYSYNFLQNEAVPGIAFEYRLVERLLPEITPAEVNRLADQYVGTENRSVLIYGPERESDNLPSREELAVVIEAVQAKQIDPYQDIEAVTALLTDIPQPADIISRQTDETYNITDLTLANGARVLLKPTTFKEEEVLFSAASPGGSSLVTDEDYPETHFINNIIYQSGIGDVSYAALQRLLADRSVRVIPFIEELEEGFYGYAGKDHVETVFQLLYLYGTAPRADEDAFATVKDRFTENLRNRELMPQNALTDAVTQARYGTSVRHAAPTLEMIESLDLERAFSIYQERFADFSDFTFLFVGNFDVERMVAWSQIYLGNLPSLHRVETWQDVAPDPPAGIVELPVYRGQEEQSFTQILFTGPGEDTPANRLRLRILETILNILMREELREERGGVYSSFASARMLPYPDGLYEISFFFGSDPERAQELVDLLFALIAGVQTDSLRDDLLAKAKAQIIHRREEQLELNHYWQNVLRRYTREEGVDLADFVDLEIVANRVEAVTAADIQASAAAFLPLERYIRVSLYPEDFEQ